MFYYTQHRRCSGRLHGSTNPPAADPQQMHSPSVYQKNHCCYSGEPWIEQWQRSRVTLQAAWGQFSPWSTEENPCFCAAILCSPRTWAGAGVIHPLSCHGERVYDRAAAPCAPGSELLNNTFLLERLSPQQNIQKAFLWLPRGKELNSQEVHCLWVANWIGQENSVSWGQRGQKGGKDIHGKTAGAYGPILKRDYLNLHNKKCRHRLNSTQTTYKSIGCLCSPGAPFYASLNWILKVTGKIILGFSYKISMRSGSFLLNHFCASGMESNQVPFFNMF